MELQARECPEDKIQEFVTNNWKGMTKWMKDHELKRVRDDPGGAEAAKSGFKILSGVTFPPIVKPVRKKRAPKDPNAPKKKRQKKKKQQQQQPAVVVQPAVVDGGS